MLKFFENLRTKNNNLDHILYCAANPNVDPIKLNVFNLIVLNPSSTSFVNEKKLSRFLNLNLRKL